MLCIFVSSNLDLLRRYRYILFLVEKKDAKFAMLPFEKIVPRFKLHVTLIRATESCHSDETFLFFFVKKLREERMLDFLAGR